MLNKKGAFTITELVIAIGIIGVIATMTIPNIMRDINRKILVSQIKNTVASLQQVVADEIVQKRTTNLKDTDFGEPERLLSEDHFEILRKCSRTDRCWGNYRFLNPAFNSSTNVSIDAGSCTTIKLRNGVVLCYSTSVSGKENVVGRFYIDINGNDDPNIVGRDFFALYLTDKGKLTGDYTKDNNNNTLKCYTTNNLVKAGYACMQSLMDNNWKMPDNDFQY